LTEAEDDFVQPESSIYNDDSKTARCEEIRPQSIQEVQDGVSFKSEQKASVEKQDYLEPKSYRSFEPAPGSDVIDLD
jgi:hypothetical protein